MCSAAYEERVERFGRAAAREALASAWFSRARLTVVLVAIVAGGLGLWRPSMASFAFGLAAGGLTALVILMARHERIEQRREAAETLVQINREAAARLRRRWNDLPAAWAPEGLDEHPNAADLDLFGHASLAQILGPVRTPAGRVTLCRWLLAPDSTPVDDIPGRQAAVRELAPLLDFRQQFTGLSRRIVPSTTIGLSDVMDTPGLDPRDTPGLKPRGHETAESGGDDVEIGQFVRWAEATSWLLSRPWVSILAIFLAVATLGLLVVAGLGWWPNALWLVTATAGWMLRWFVHPQLDASYAGAEHEHGLRSFTALLALISGTAFSAPVLRAAQAALHGRSSHAHTALRRLEQLVALADVRLSVWLYLPLQTLTLWELHVWLLIERWRRAHGRDVRYWLTAVGHVEALSALASLAHDHPEWTFPRVTTGEPRIDARALGHPLLADAVRVANDVQRRPAGPLPAHHRLEHVGQEHAAARDRPQPGARARRRAGLRRRVPAPPAGAAHEHARRRLARAGLVALHGLARAAPAHRPRRARRHARSAGLLSARRGPAGHQQRRASGRRPHHRRSPARLRRHRRRHHARSRARAPIPRSPRTPTASICRRRSRGDGDRVTMTFDYRLAPGPGVGRQCAAVAEDAGAGLRGMGA